MIITKYFCDACGKELDKYRACLYIGAITKSGALIERIFVGDEVCNRCKEIIKVDVSIAINETLKKLKEGEK